MPLIHHLVEKGCDVYLAAEGASAAILKAYFPALPVLPLKGYGIQYSHKPGNFTFKLLAQVPKILRRIKEEHRWLQKQQKRYHFDAVISDNRYGLYTPDCPCVIMTHQVQIMSGKGAWADRKLLQWHRRLLEQFEDCWVVDTETQGLSGRLAHPETKPKQSTYIGLLSQFMLLPAIEKAEKHCLVLLSGPEPMRTQLEALLWAQCVALPQYKFIFVAGKPGGTARETVPPHIHYHPYLGGVALHTSMAEAALVVCRSGYSSLMDLAFLQKKAILIPTPGQTEQEYLAGHLHASGNYYSEPQATIELGKVLPLLWHQPYDVQGAADNMPAFREVIDRWLDR
ncbi:glycosyl transferase [Taibaiella sp. KBW10]|nr:glycosyl transferase [Taibaiella sp. KBW10]